MLGNRERRNVFALSEDSRQAIDPYAREATLGYSRNLIANDGMIRGMIFDMTRYSIGTGLKPQSQAANDNTADEYEAYFADWVDRCDVTGKFSFYELERLVSRAIDGDGDIGCHWLVNGPRSDPQIQLVEGHRIGSNGVSEKDGWHDGVRTDDVGRPLAYRVREGDKEFRTIDAAYFTLLMDPDRCDQDRGIGALSHAINNSFDRGDIVAFSKMGIKMREAIGFVVYTETGNHDSGLGLIQQGDTKEETGSLAIDTLQAGMIPRLKTNERVEDIGGNRPNSAFGQGILEYLNRDAASGFGLPFEFVWDPTKLGSGVQRFVLSKAGRRFEERQDYIGRKLVKQAWARVIGPAIARKELPPDRRWRAIMCQPVAKITTDIGREAQQNREDLKFGNRTLAQDIGETGGDWKDTRAQIEKETRDLLTRAFGLMKDFPELTLDQAIQLMRQNSPNPQPAQPDQQAASSTGTGDQ